MVIIINPLTPSHSIALTPNHWCNFSACFPCMSDMVQVIWYQLELAKFISGLISLASLPWGPPLNSSFGQDGQGMKQHRDSPSLLPMAICQAHITAGIQGCT